MIKSRFGPVKKPDVISQALKPYLTERRPKLIISQADADNKENRQHK